jgi:uncharacterized protein with HEPN domain
VMRSYKLYLNDISDSMQKILDYTKGIDYDEFTENSMIFDAVIRNFEIIGEAAKNIPADIKSRYPGIPWSDMVGMRNILSHGYFGIDYSIVWSTIELLPKMLEEIAHIQALNKEGSQTKLESPGEIPGDDTPDALK